MAGLTDDQKRSIAAVARMGSQGDAEREQQLYNRIAAAQEGHNDKRRGT